MHRVNVMDPTVRPKATEEIDAMIGLVSDLIDKGHAYEVDGDVYFSVRSYPGYGALSGRNVDEMEGGHRELRTTGIEERKQDPLDFALWKASKPGEPSWPSPWGEGRPGWHIECSAMSRKYLGLPFDIHGGGADLVFPHHENERAQSEAACDCEFAHHWMHGGMLQINGEKMSKSLNNFFLLRDILETVDPQVLRFLMAQTHYRSPLDFSDARVDEARVALERIANTLKNIDWALSHADGAESVVDADEAGKLIQDTRIAFVVAMDDDVNAPKALGEVFDFVARVNTLIGDKTLSEADTAPVRAIRDLLIELMGVFGIDIAAYGHESADSGYPQEVVALAVELADYAGADTQEAVDALLDARAQARAAKDWGKADAVRDRMAALGFTIMDTPQGARVEFASA